MAAASGLGIRVIWDGATVDERAFYGRAEVRVGAGARATTVAPGGDDRYLRFRRRAGAVELIIDAGAADRVILEGEAPVELTGRAEPLVLRIDPKLAFGRVEMGGAVVEFEPVGLEKEARDRGIWAWSLAALVVALSAGGSYRAVRLLTDGWRHPSDSATALSHDEAAMLRVRIGPDGAGASRPQAGMGKELVAHPARPQLPDDPPNAAVDSPRVLEEHPATPPRKTRKKRARKAPDPTAGLAKAPDGPTDLPVDPPHEKPQPQPQEAPQTRDQVIEHAEAALLEADLRTAVDGFSRAAEQGELTYEQLSLLGLAHYLTLSLDDAEQAWKRSQAMEPGLPDPIVNLAHVARRRGDTTREIQLLDEALAMAPADCKALNSLALAQARTGNFTRADEVRLRAAAACGDAYAYGMIDHAGILALAGNTRVAMEELARGLAVVDTLVPIKEYEVYADLTVDPAFASLRGDARFRPLLEKHLPRAVKLAATTPTAAPKRVPTAAPAPPLPEPEDD